MNKLMRTMTEVQKQNPGLTLENGNRHVHVRMHGKLVAILPFAPRRKGLAENTKAALRRAGVQLPS